MAFAFAGIAASGKLSHVRALVRDNDEAALAVNPIVVSRGR